MKIPVRSGRGQRPKMSATAPTEAGWVRIPVRGTLPGAPFSRGAVYQLIKDGKVRTASVPVHGKRGIRMVWMPSLLALVEAHATGPIDGAP